MPAALKAFDFGPDMPGSLCGVAGVRTRTCGAAGAADAVTGARRARAAHGGLTTLGANTFSMAIIGPWVAYGVYRALRGSGASLAVATFTGAALADLVTYATTSLQLALAFPDLQLFNVVDEIAVGTALPALLFWQVAGFGGMYILVYFLLAQLVFSTREL